KYLGQFQSQIFTSIADPAVQALSVIQAMPVDPATGMHSPFPGFQALWGGGATLGQALRPFAQYQIDTVEVLSHLLDFGAAVGVSPYHALPAQASKPFAQCPLFM